MIREVAVARLVVESEEEAAFADGRRNLDRCFLPAERARPDLGRAVCTCRLLRHDVDDTADEGARKTRGDIAAVDLDALDVADGDRRDVDRRIAAEVRQHAVDEYADLCRCRAAHRHRRILPLAVDLTHMHTGNHLEEVGQGLLLALELLWTDDSHGTGGEDLLPRRAFCLNGDIGRRVFAGGCCSLLAIHGRARRRRRLCSGRRMTQHPDEQHPQDTRDKMLLFPFLGHERASVFSFIFKIYRQ